MSKHINIDGKKITRWMQTQVATSTRLKTRMKRTSVVAMEMAKKSNADSLIDIAKDLEELITKYEPVHKRYVEINNQMLRTNKLAQAANNVR